MMEGLVNPPEWYADGGYGRSEIGGGSEENGSAAPSAKVEGSSVSILP